MRNIFKYGLLAMAIAVTSVGVRAQDIPVSGVVKDKSNNSTLPYASVIVKNESGKTVPQLSTTTDDNGRFSTKVKSGYRLVFSFLAFDSLSVKVTKPSERMQIYLSPTENMLDETVVVGFKRVSKAAVTASVTVIKAEDLVNTPVANPMELLQGRVPGLNIQMNNGTPGGLPSFSIRGVSDISVQSSGDGEFMMGLTPPLFVVDGIPQEDVTGYDAAGLLSGATVSPLAMIPLEDIANIQVLKDAAATSLYGSKGAYGVILIETKRGETAKPKVSYSANFVVKTPPRLRDVLAGGAERALRIMQILGNDTSAYHGYNEIHKLQALSDSLNPYYNNNTGLAGCLLSDDLQSNS